MARCRCAWDLGLWSGSKIGGALASAIVVWFAAIAFAPKLSADASVQEAAAGSGDQGRFVVEIGRRLKVCRERISVMGPMVLAEIEARSRAKDEETNRMIAVETVKANFGNAELIRQVAEIAVMEYEEGIFKQDEATASSEVLLAEADWQRAKDAVEFSKERLNQLKVASKGTAGDVATVYLYEDHVLETLAREPKAKLALEQAQTKLKILREYTRPKMMKELQAAVLKAQVDELTKKADWEREKAKLDRVVAGNRGGQVQLAAAQPLSDLKRASAAEEKVRAGMTELRKAGAFDADRGKGLEAIVKELEGLVDETEVGLGMIRVDRLRKALDAAAGRPGGGAKRLRQREEAISERGRPMFGARFPRS